MRGTRIGFWCAASAVAGAALTGLFTASMTAQGTRTPQGQRAYVQAGPEPNGTPVPRTASPLAHSSAGHRPSSTPFRGSLRSALSGCA